MTTLGQITTLTPEQIADILLQTDNRVTKDVPRPKPTIKQRFPLKYIFRNTENDPRCLNFAIHELQHVGLPEKTINTHINAIFQITPDEFQSASTIAGMQCGESVIFTSDVRWGTEYFLGVKSFAPMSPKIGEETTKILEKNMRKILLDQLTNIENDPDYSYLFTTTNNETTPERTAPQP